ALVAASRVPDDVFRAGVTGLLFATAHNRVQGELTLLWFEAISPDPERVTFRGVPNLRGVAHRRSNAVALCVDQSPADAVEAGAHEGRHLVHDPDVSTEAKEADAKGYGLAARKLLVSLRGERECVGVLHAHNGLP